MSSYCSFPFRTDAIIEAFPSGYLVPVRRCQDPGTVPLQMLPNVVLTPSSGLPPLGPDPILSRFPNPFFPFSASRLAWPAVARFLQDFHMNFLVFQEPGCFRQTQGPFSRELHAIVVDFQVPPGLAMSRPLFFRVFPINVLRPGRPLASGQPRLVACFGGPVASCPPQLFGSFPATQK